MRDLSLTVRPFERAPEAHQARPRAPAQPFAVLFGEWRDPDSNRGHHDFQSFEGVLGRVPARQNPLLIGILTEAVVAVDGAARAGSGTSWGRRTRRCARVRRYRSSEGVMMYPGRSAPRRGRRSTAGTVSVTRVSGAGRLRRSAWVRPCGSGPNLQAARSCPACRRRAGDAGTRPGAPLQRVGRAACRSSHAWSRPRAYRGRPGPLVL